MPAASPTSVNSEGSVAMVALRPAYVDDLAHRAVEIVQHGGVGACDLQIGIAAEGLGHGARLAALRPVLLLAVAVEPAAHQTVIDDGRRYEDRRCQQGDERVVDGQHPEEQRKENGLAGQGGHGHQHARDEGEADDVDVARQNRRVGFFDESQPLIAITDVEAS